MKIGIDLSVLQTDHRYRGIGAVIVNFINNLNDEDKKTHSFVFFVEKKDEQLAYEQLNLTGIEYTTSYMHNKHYSLLPGKLSLLSKAAYKLAGFVQYYTGDPRITRKQLAEIDRFIQFDQNRKLPRLARSKAALFLHDLIPYVMESDYLWSYKTARRNGRSRKGAVKFWFQRLQYAARLKASTRRAKLLIANSEHTKKDFTTHLGINPSKIYVAHLGVNTPAIAAESIEALAFKDYRTTMWGVVKRDFDPSKKPFLFFTGGMDHRRKIVELLAAFNNLKARGEDVSLILSGDTVEGMNDIRNTVIKDYLKDNQSYIADIHLLGHTSNAQRDWLYGHALAFVFPSVYEGFGLPVLEAMSYGAPTVTFSNTSIVEVAGDKALYATDFIDIANLSSKLLNESEYAKKVAKLGAAHASGYTWEKTKTSILTALAK